MFNKIGSRYGWGKFESCLSNYGQNELQVFFNPCLQPLKVFPEKKTANILQYHQRFPHEMISEEQAQKFHPQTSFLARELMKALQNVACFLRLLKVTSFKCSSNAANVSDPVFLLFIISFTSSLIKNVKRRKNYKVQAVPVKGGYQTQQTYFNVAWEKTWHWFPQEMISE